MEPLPLALAALVRLHALAFLGRPRSTSAAEVRTTDGPHARATLALAALPIALGLATSWWPGVLARPVEPLTHTPDPGALHGGLALAFAGEAHATLAPWSIAVLGALTAVAAMYLGILLAHAH